MGWKEIQFGRRDAEQKRRQIRITVRPLLYINKVIRYAKGRNGFARFMVVTRGRGAALLDLVVLCGPSIYSTEKEYAQQGKLVGPTRNQKYTLALGR